MNSARKIIFLVDDDMTNLMLGKKALSEAYSVFTLDSAKTMFEMLESVMPDMILLDVNMPDINGHAAIEKLKANAATANIPVIFLTAMGEENMELLGLSLGAIDYISKPFSPALLLKRIEVHLLVESQKRELVKFNSTLSHMVEEKTATVVELKNAILSTLAELVEYRDKITGGHILRTQRYIQELVIVMKAAGVYTKELSDLDESLILQSCQLHDVGKIAIKDAILNKPGKLTPEEFEEIKTHTIFGEKAILRIKEKTTDSDFLEYARIFALTHHERWDGRGYPYGLAGDNIPLLGRIMAIADVYDALVETRPYKTAFSHDRAIEIIAEGKGSHFDPAITDLFVQNNDIFRKIADEVK